MRLADYVIQFLENIGITTIFLVPGGGAMHLNDALAKSKKIKYVACHHEQAAAIAAEAYARVTGGLGVVMVTCGPGGTNAVTAVAGAWIESIPLLVISGQVKRTDLKEEGIRQKGVQEVDIINTVYNITKFATTIMTIEETRSVLELAINDLQSNRKGPVWLDIPLDIQASEINPDEELPYLWFQEQKKLDPDLQRIFLGRDKIVERLESSQRPLILAGHGVRLAGAANEFKELYEKLGIPIATTWNALDLISSNHVLNVGCPGAVALRAANFAVQNCDLLLIIGARLDNVTTAYNPDNFARNAYRIMVDVDAHEFHKFKKPMDKIVLLDAKDFIVTLLKEQIPTKKKFDWVPWITHCNKLKQEYSLREEKKFPKSGPISHYHAVQALSDAIPEDALIVTGSSGLAIEALYMGFQNKPGQRMFLNTGLGAMGYGLPSIIGAYFADPSKRLIGIESDGSLQMNIQELATIAYHKIPVILFILNNNGYASIRNTQKNYFEGRYIGTGKDAGLMFPDILDIADAYNISAMRITKASDLKNGIKDALKNKGPYICDIRLIENEALEPRCSSKLLPDGSMATLPLEDMSPLLSLEELKAALLVPLDPISESIRA